MFIHRIRNVAGDWESDPQKMAETGIEYFINLLSDTTAYDSDYWEFLHSEINKYIPKLVTDEDNSLLQQIPDNAEIHQAVFSLDPESAAGPDGYTGHFFSKGMGHNFL